MTKLPVEIENFAKKYFAAEARAVHREDFGLSFHEKDKRTLAHECKAILASGIIGSMNKLSQVLEDYGNGHRVTHTYRLHAFAKAAGIKYPSIREVQEAAEKARKAVVHRTPTHSTAPALSIRAELSASFQKWLSSGMTLASIQAEAQQVLVDCNHKLQVGKVTTGLHELMRNTGLTPNQLADIARSL